MKRFKKFILIVLLAMCGCVEQVVHDLAEPQANQLMARLSDAGIETSKVKQPDGRWSLEVAKADVVESIKVIQRSRVFRNEIPVADNPTGLISNRADQQYRTEQRISNAIAATLSSMAGVLEARVHLNLPPTDPLFGHRLESKHSGSASVLIISRQGEVIDRDAIASLVSGAAGIKKENIAVVSHQQPTEEQEVKDIEQDEVVTGTALGALSADTQYLLILASLLILMGGALLYWSLKRSSRTPLLEV